MYRKNDGKNHDNGELKTMSEGSLQSKMDKLIEALYSIFQLEDSNLDFGIYRLRNIKAKEISNFIKTELNIFINEHFNKADPSYKFTENDKGTIYDLLLTFFSRYYDKGDFLPKRRYSKNEKYHLPYNGEETYFYWVNYDQYYIKTYETIRDYSFIIGDNKFNFIIEKGDSENEKGNNKEQRKRYPIFTGCINRLNGLIRISFNNRSLTESEEKAILETTNKQSITLETIIQYNAYLMRSSKELQSFQDLFESHKLITDEKTEKTELDFHLSKFIGRNTSDYFIHKNLSAYLQNELMDFIKNEVISLNFENLESLQKTHFKIQIFKKISEKIISFLSQIEDFQKRLWEKTKFILKTDYLITLDLIHEDYYPKIIENQAQINHWQDLNLLDVNNPLRNHPQESLEKKTSKKQSGNASLDSFAPNRDNVKEKKENKASMLNKSIEYLKSHPSLMLDTKFFDDDFKLEILSKIQDLDKKIDGILMNSDNFHALKMLLGKYNHQISCIYIDPPYNTGNDEFIYKDGFQHSSWLSMMHSRITLANSLLSEKGLFFTSLDDHEIYHFKLLMDKIFGEENFLANVIWYSTKSVTNTALISLSHTYTPIYAKNLEYYTKNRTEFRLTEDGEGFSNPDNDPRGPWKADNFQVGGWRPNQQYEIVNPKTGKTYKPNPGNSWKNDYTTYLELVKENRIVFGVKGDAGPMRKRFLSEAKERGKVTHTMWIDLDTTSNATKNLKNMFGEAVFNNPKPTNLIERILQLAVKDKEIVLDFFAGSGTTAEATIRLNNQEKTKRKYILVEMGSYFDRVLKSRIQKVIYSDNWKEGKPENGQSTKNHIIKYHYLEDFEDSIRNIRFKDTQGTVIQSDDYKLNYMLDYESKDSPVFLNIDSLNRPFEYTLSAQLDGKVADVRVDLIETFNYALGIEVLRIERKIDRSRCYLIIKGTRQEKKVIVIWTTKDETFDPVRDKEFTESEILSKERFEEIYVNGNSLIENAIALDKIFKAKLSA